LQVTSNAATAYTNAVNYVTAQTYANTLQVTSNAATAYTNAVNYVTAQSYANTAQVTANAATAYTNATTFASNATNISSGTLAYSIIPANIINTTAAFTIGGVHTYTANISTTANINFSNTTAVAVIFANTSNVYFTGIAYNANNSTTVGGNTAATLRSYSDTMAATAYTNAVNYVTAQSYANTLQVTSNAATAYTNAVNYVTAQSFANTLQVTSNATTAYTNAITWSGNAALAYANAVTFASNATNISSGTLGYSLMPANIVNTTASFTFSSQQTYTANIATSANIVISNTTGSGVLFANTTNAYFTGIALNAWAANSASFVGAVSAANVVSNSQLSSNLANYVTTTGLSGFGYVNSSSGTAFNSSNLAGVAASNYLLKSGGTLTGPLTGTTVTTTGFYLTTTGASERHFMWQMTDRNVYFYGQDIGNKLVGLYAFNTLINRCYSNRAGALVVME